ncbi:hypothetical protein E1265_35580, partial [Streptomyces sp. 8K308]
MERPSGAPQTLQGDPTVSPPGEYTGDKVEKLDAPAGETPEVEGDQGPTGETPGEDMEPPGFFETVGGIVGGLMDAVGIDLGGLTDALRSIPTTDDGLKDAKVGRAAPVPLEDDTDPQRTDEQQSELKDKSAELKTQGREDAAQPMGEDQIFPTVPGETLTGAGAGGSGQDPQQQGAAGGPASPQLPADVLGAVAEHEQGPQIQAAFGQGQERMLTEKTAKDEGFLTKQREHDQRVQAEIDANSSEQESVRTGAATEVEDARQQWQQEQDEQLAEVEEESGAEYERVRDDIETKKTETDDEVETTTQEENDRIQTEKTKAETEAQETRDEGEEESGNWLSEAIDWIKEQFNKLKNAIVEVFNAAREAVVGIIEEFKQTVFDLIDAARNFIVDAINVFADILIGLGDILLAGFPELRDKWRDTINGARDAAIDTVNDLADGLKERIGSFLDGLAAGLTALLDVLEAGLLAAVDVVEGVVTTAMEIAGGLLSAYGDLAVIAVDIMADPGGWIGKLGASAEDGAKNHLFNEIQKGVKQWVAEKIQEILGLDQETFQLLVNGGMTAEEMVEMAWEAALPQLPIIIGELVITKVVAKLIPGAGWILAILDAIQTAIGALGAILRAFQLVLAFLKAVKGGGAGKQFAVAVAAGVVALLELIYQALVSGIAKYMGKVTGRLKSRANDMKRDGGPNGRDEQDRRETQQTQQQVRNAEQDMRTPPPA